MPFERYLIEDEPSSSSSSSSTGNDYHQHAYHSSPSGPFSYGPGATFRPPQIFQLPQFMLGGPPTLAPGGGAEVLPAGLMNASGGISWLANNGFPQKSAHQAYPAPTQRPQKWFNAPETAPPMQDYVGGGVEAAFANEFSMNQAQLHLPEHHQMLAAPPQTFESQPNPSERRPPPSDHPPIAQAPESQPPLVHQPSPWNAYSTVSAPSPLGLPVYSSSGFDLLSILARVATRPNPTITLGPVDMSCSFVVVDVRRYDAPIVYASPEFYRLTGYSEREVLGRNCRFLQAPGGRVTRGERRSYTAGEAVSYLRKSFDGGKECQTSLVNYRKDGSAFINLVTVIPVPGVAGTGDGKSEEVMFHVGFQVDLTEQPNAILQKLRDGSYMVNYGSNITAASPGVGLSFGSRERKNYTYAMSAVSAELHTLLEDPSFTRLALEDKNKDSASDKSEWYEGNNILSLLLLHMLPDAVLVLSLKGSFLYVAPAISRILGHPPSALVGKSIVDFCHPADTVPLMRELKESSSGAPYDSGVGSYAPRGVNLLFRALAADGTYGWLECTGRLHVEPGKGRKAIILSARPRWMPTLAWKWVPQGVAAGEDADPEVWGMLSAGGTVLFMGQGVLEVLGWAVGEAIGMSVRDFVKDEAQRGALETALRRAGRRELETPDRIACRATRKGGGTIGLVVCVYPLPTSARGVPPLVCQFVVADSVDAMSVAQREARGEGGNEGQDMFEALNVARESSWQYELQQLKIENGRLAQEVEALQSAVSVQERELAGDVRMKMEGEVEMHVDPVKTSGGRGAILEEYLQTLADPEWASAPVVQGYRPRESSVSNVGTKRRWEP